MPLTQVARLQGLWEAETPGEGNRADAIGTPSSLGRKGRP